ncbi:ATP-binding protein [Lihuaxuella thermophila]|uniref:histidine kinase n=1 Tax=Lihuaxuella thermophila TaxID=1173111 RepID=A0A1H8BH48_9BACL|nr:ATP-binding protein [Lihuaxuella thermophila]SEM82153.1 two-component system, OmpR family, sensor histidine kinase VicK [Lihuaxuella thermophila]
MKKWTEYVNSVQWKLVVIYILLTIMAMQLIGVFFISRLQSYYLTDLRNDLHSQANMLSDRVGNALQKHKYGAKEERTKEITELLNLLVFLKSKDQTSTVVNILDEKGFIVGTTSSKQSEMKKRLFNLPAKNTFSFRSDPATGQDYLSYIQLMKRDGRLVGYIHIETSLEKTYETIRRITEILIKITAVALFTTGFLIIILARTITTPVKEITEQATAMAAGDFDRQVDVRSKDEIGRLAMAFNHLASHLRTAIAQKEEEKEKLESVLANMSDGVIAADRTGKVIVKNNWAEKLLDRKIELGEPIFDILSLSEPFSLPLLEERQTFLERNANDPEETTIIKITFTPIKPHGQEEVGFVAVLEDVTEQEKLDRQRKDFVANVSHELRTPLTTIKSYLEALDDGAIHEPELASRFLKVTRQEADRMTRLISDLLQLSRLDAKKSRFNKKAVQVEEMLEEAADRFAFQCREKSISLTLCITDKLPRVYADRDKIDQVLDNLISNAVKYTPEGGSIAIVAAKRPGGMVEISVADTGIGIPKKDLGRIFERFYRVDKARSRRLGGTGLGLSIAKEIIQAHEGEIEIDSIYGKGTIVSFTLPACVPEVVQ